ncbi:2-dehydro-3-deoxygluconokinase [hydrothermal vent metagenome]|uniref:2-dehydro-3-deoxygluconokinase n=1 Tax=hydrothermal vent metagenome TaxID=652676 RepID=A0A3B0V5L4_9ZZZZ
MAQFGLHAALVTALPSNPIGDDCIRFLRGYRVDTSLIQRRGERIGIYFLEAGANQRPSQVIYDRAHSAIAEANADSFDWDAIFDGASWLHVTGITPAISQSAADLTLTAVQKAQAHNVTISCDTSYRSKLWQYGKRPIQVMPHIAQYVNMLFANREDCQLSYGVQLSEAEAEGLSEAEQNQRIAEKMFATFPQLCYQVFTHREGFSASHNAWQASLYNSRSFITSRRYDITHIVDRVGGGDALVAGLIYGLSTGMSDEESLEFAAAAACLKHTIPGDINLVSVAEIKQLRKEDVSGRVQR